MNRIALTMTALFAVMTVLCVIGWYKALTPSQSQVPAAMEAHTSPTPEAEPQPSETAADVLEIADPEPEAPFKPWAAWVAESPLRVKMRAMWFDSGIIVANSMYPDIADRGALQLAASDIASKAAGFAGHWEDIRTKIREAAASANASNWAEVRKLAGEAEMACEGCHFENWSFATRGVRGEHLQAWHDEDTVFTGRQWDRMDLNSAPQWVSTMLQMRATLRGATRLASRQDKDGVLRLTRTVHDFADDQARRWRSIEAQSNAIARIAEGGRLEDVSAHYHSMRRACMDCHNQYAPERGLAPVDWK
jgi:cytochrome c556